MGPGHAAPRAGAPPGGRAWAGSARSRRARPPGGVLPFLGGGVHPLFPRRAHDGFGRLPRLEQVAAIEGRAARCDRQRPDELKRATWAIEAMGPRWRWLWQRDE